ncbi:uncharacterized protein EV154DRAFT_300500 [Mucor mucedo]|uniref:uncharacterized protein n=1 Tax=Mucor mucedo TaxID=29922 RepID=UPI00221FBD6F|nr:uncharacterized protein EV154DRAFT_300500 [Mucor mucedo]KAI7895982.1 hypothetical protein EV154DRAFT_300500 [Mucor mucedo]
MEVRYTMKDFPEPGDKDLANGISYMNKSDFKNALKHFEKSATYNNEYGLLFFGIFLLLGFGLSKRDPAKALDTFKKVAHLFSNRVAHYLIGILYYEGDKDVPQNIQSAYHWILNAAKLGWIDAMSQMGFAYCSGAFGKEDKKKGVHWLEKVVHNDSRDTVLYLFGNKEFQIDMTHQDDIVLSSVKGVTAASIISPVQCAAQCFAANPFSSNGIIYRAIFWDTMTNRQNTSLATSQLILGTVYMEDDGISTDKKKKAIALLKKSGENGNAKACLTIGHLYEMGNGVDQDYSEAMAWYLKSKDIEGEVDALQSIGRLYFTGHGVKQDFMLALSYFNTYNLHAEDREVYYMMAEIYKIGKDYKQSFLFFSKAADLGHAASATRLGLFYRIGFGVEKSETKSFAWMQKAAALNCPMAQFTLGQMHYDGYKGKSDHVKALDYFEKSLKNGFAPAAFMVEQLKFQKSLRDLHI